MQSSLAEQFMAMSEAERANRLQRLTTDERKLLAWSWPIHARPDQLAPAGDWWCWMIMSGRGWGKTRTGAQWIIERAEQGLGPIALIGQTAGDVRDTMIELGDSCIMRCSPPWFTPTYEPSKRRLTWPNGVTATTFSGDEPDQLRGPQHQTVWADEPAKWKNANDAWSNMEFGLRLGESPRCMATTTPRPIPLIKQLLADARVHVTRGNTMDNASNLSGLFLDRMRERYEGTRLGRQELAGELLDDNPNALWQRINIETARLPEAPQLQRVVVGVDPAATSNASSDETGIVVAGVARVNGVTHGYILDDLTIKGSPETWGKRAVLGYRKHEADRIVAEVNNGGEMVAHVIHTQARNVPVRQVRATRGKALRAEPIAALYEQGRVHHVGVFPELEDQMCEFDPSMGNQKSPDRMDALVWTLTELMINGGSGTYAATRNRRV